MDRSIAIPLRALNKIQKETIDSYISAFDPATVFVGALPGVSDRDIRPLFLRNGHLHILRNIFREQPWSSEENTLVDNLHKIFIVQADFYRQADEFWYVRPFFSSLLSNELVNATMWDLPFCEQQIAHLFGQLAEAHGFGIIHGHIHAGNIGFDGKNLQLIDFATYLLTLSVTDDGLRLTDSKMAQKEADAVSLSEVFLSVLSEQQCGIFYQSLKAIGKRDIGRGEILALVKEIRSLADSAVNPELSVSTKRLGNFIPGGLELHDQSEYDPANSKDSEKEEEKFVAVDIGTGAPEKFSVPSAAKVLEAARNTSSLSSEVVAEIRQAISSGVPVQESFQNPFEVMMDKKTSLTDAPPSNQVQTFKSMPGPASKSNEPKAEEIFIETENSDIRGIFYTGLAILALAIGGFYFFKAPAQEPVVLENLPLDEYWQSNIPSKMKEVVSRAVLYQQPDAELVILRDVIAGNKRPNVRLDLLQVAFSTVWEHELSESDRQLALLLGLSDLIPKKPANILPLSRAHPGLVLAVVSSIPLNQPASKATDIPISKAASLPEPFRSSYAALQALGVRSFSQLEARALSKILVGQINDHVIFTFLNQAKDSVKQIGYLRVLINLFDVKPDLPNAIDSAILHGAPSDLKKAWKWFIADTFGLWSNLKPAERSYIYAGLLDRIDFAIDQLADLTQFPVLQVRHQAVQRLLATEEDAVQSETFEYLGSSENKLNREQVVSLVLALAEPANTKDSLIAVWFSSNPDPDAVLKILQARANIEGFDSFSIEGARYLKDLEFKLSINAAKKLLNHKELLVRALVYSRLDPEIDVEKNLLEFRLKVEPDPNLLKQIKLKLDEADGKFILNEPQKAVEDSEQEPSFVGDL